MSRVAWIAAGVTAGAVAGWLVGRSTASSGPTEGEAPATPPALVEPGTVLLAEESQRRIGLQLMTLAAASGAPPLAAHGWVLDPSPLVPLIAEHRTTQAAAEAAARELRRLEELNAREQTVPTRSVEAARAAHVAAQAAADSARQRLASAWGPGLAALPELERLAAALVEQRAALVRIDLPLEALGPEAPTDAWVAPLHRPSERLEARFVGPVQAVDSQLQTRSLLYLLHSGATPPGAAVVAWLTFADGADVTGVIVPAAAVVRAQGRDWVYVRAAADRFVRTAVTLTRPVADGWFVSGSLQAGDTVVLAGAQQLWSSERAAADPVE